MKTVAVLLMFLQTVTAGAAEGPHDYAYGIAIHADATEALQEFEVPAAVYRGVTRNDLGDVRVFNGQGEVVPHALRPRMALRVENNASVDLPVFPFYGQVGDKTDDAKIRVEKRRDGTIVSIQSRTKSNAPDQRLRGYLVDVSTLKQPVKALMLDWRSSPEGFVGKVSIAGSDDFAAWTTLIDQAALVRLTFGGQQLNQNRVELPRTKYRYLRVTWPDHQVPLESLKLVAELADNQVAVRRVWQSVTGSTVSTKTGEYVYDLGGVFPFDRLHLELPQINTLAPLQILARQKSSDEWRPKTNAVVYRLRRGDAEVTSSEITMSGDGERYLLLRAEQKGGGIGTGVPLLQIGWIPQKLVFAARGVGPFQLVYGNSAAKATAYPIESLIPGYKTDGEFQVKQAALGDPVTLAGATRLREPIDYKKWTVWIVLVLGVAALGWMAYRLSHQISPPSSQPTDKSD
jgi:hypothetical protein